MNCLEQQAKAIKALYKYMSAFTITSAKDLYAIKLLTSLNVCSVDIIDKAHFQMAEDDLGYLKAFTSRHDDYFLLHKLVRLLVL